MTPTDNSLNTFELGQMLLKKATILLDIIPTFLSLSLAKINNYKDPTIISRPSIKPALQRSFQNLAELTKTAPIPTSVYHGIYDADNTPYLVIGARIIIDLK